MLLQAKTIKVNNRKVVISPRDRALLTTLSISTPKQLAEDANVSVKTIYSQLRVVLTKLNVRTYEKAIKKARKLGLVEQA